MVEVRWAGNAVPERAEAESWGTVPALVGTVLVGTCCWEGVVEGGGASIFMALDSWGCCALVACKLGAPSK